MKKNITINLAGQLFAIDEDAYALLLDYTETLRRYYRRQAEGEEVVDDIEARIAELFSELKYHGYNAITIEHVQTIIERIGKLEDLTDNAESADSNTTEADGHPGGASAAQAVGDGVRGAWNKVHSGKRFYRDTENKVLAGVLSGLSRYFGGDVVIWRAVFLILIFAPLPFIGSLQGITGLFPLAYLIIAIVAPAASTPEERLKMRGEDVNPQNLASEVNRANSANAYNEAAGQRRHAISTICAILLIIFSVWMWLGFLGVLCGACAVLVAPEFLNSDYFSELRHAPYEAAYSLAHGIFYILAAVEVCIFVMAYCSMHTGLSLLDKVKAMSLKERLIWLAVWAASIVGIVLTSINFAREACDFEHKYPYDWEATTEVRIEYEDSTDASNDSIYNIDVDNAADPDASTHE